MFIIVVAYESIEYDLSCVIFVVVYNLCVFRKNKHNNNIEEALFEFHFYCGWKLVSFGYDYRGLYGMWEERHFQSHLSFNNCSNMFLINPLFPYLHGILYNTYVG